MFAEESIDEGLPWVVFEPNQRRRDGSVAALVLRKRQKMGSAHPVPIFQPNENGGSISGTAVCDDVTGV